MRKIFSLFLFVLFVCVLILNTSCGSTDVVQLSTMPEISEKMTVYGISHIDNPNMPDFRMFEIFADADAREIASSIIGGIYFEYHKSDKNGSSGDFQCMQTSMSTIQNLSIKSRDMLKVGEKEYIMTQAVFNLLNNMNEKNYEALKSGVSYEAIVKVEAANLTTFKQILSEATIQIIKHFYKDDTEKISGTAWILKFEPLIEISEELSDNLNNNRKKSKYFVPNTSSDFIEVEIQIVIKKGYTPVVAEKTEHEANNLTDTSEKVITFGDKNIEIIR